MIRSSRDSYHTPKYTGLLPVQCAKRNLGNFLISSFWGVNEFHNPFIVTHLNSFFLSAAKVLTYQVGLFSTLITHIKGLKHGSPYKWSYGPLLITGRGRLCMLLLFFYITHVPVPMFTNRSPSKNCSLPRWVSRLLTERDDGSLQEEGLVF